LQFEAKRKLEQVDSLKNQFLSLTSHYLRTPLTVIKSFVYELKESPMNENQKVQLQQVEVNVSNLENLIEKMLTITSIEKGQAKVSLIPEDLNRMLSAIIMEYQLQAHTQHLSLIYQPPPSPLPQFAFDSVKLKEAISSLIDNAIKYNHLGGLVTVSTAADNKQIVIRVADNGQGIKADHLKNLFTPFNRGEMSEVLNFDKPGIGLSLYLAKLIIEAHGGRISAQSAEGKGSVFTVVLPIKSSKNLVQA
jgi:signal transduction histidine kinase